MSEENKNLTNRRSFLKKSTALSVLAATPPTLAGMAQQRADEKIASAMENIPLTLSINGKSHTLRVDPRSTLLDVVRENLHLTGSKKGCDLGQCGACTVHIDGKRELSCLTMAALVQNREVTTIEGLATNGELHPMQEAFIECDGFQCGYCTPGQIMSAVACVKEGHTSSVEEIKEFMSGNLCRCGAYNGIVEAIQKVAK